LISDEPVAATKVKYSAADDRTRLLWLAPVVDCFSSLHSQASSIEHFPLGGRKRIKKILNRRGTGKGSVKVDSFHDANVNILVNTVKNFVLETI